MSGGKFVIDPRLKDYAPESLRIKIDAVNSAGSIVSAAEILGIRVDTLGKSIRDLKARVGAIRRAEAIAPKGTDGFVARELTTAYDADGEVKAEWLREGPEAVQEPGGEDAGPARDGGDGYVIKGVSTLFDSAGNVRSQWVKTKIDDQMRDIALRAAAAALAEELPRLEALPGPKRAKYNLCNLFTFTDCHVGMMAWHREGGADWDLKIAERTLIGCFEQLVESAPSARVAVINQLGDFMHYDGLESITPQHGHILDADGRFSKMVATSIRILRRIVDIALMKHEDVHLIIAEGNHDIASSVWLRQMFAAIYENEPRMKVNDSELPYYVYQHGKVMLGFHHGHLKKIEQFPLMFAAEFPQMWGETTRRYGHAGHRHHKHELELSGMTVTQHPTMAARDAYAARGGWIASRAATSVTYHSVNGQCGSNTVYPEQLEEVA